MQTEPEGMEAAEDQQREQVERQEMHAEDESKPLLIIKITKALNMNVFLYEGKER